MVCVICLEDTTLDKMISSETPYKLAEIIRDTWPQIYRPIKKKENFNSQKIRNLPCNNL
jgi:hypothetical protein